LTDSASEDVTSDESLVRVLALNGNSKYPLDRSW